MRAPGPTPLLQSTAAIKPGGGVRAPHTPPHYHLANEMSGEACTEPGPRRYSGSASTALHSAAVLAMALPPPRTLHKVSQRSRWKHARAPAAPAKLLFESTRYSLTLGDQHWRVKLRWSRLARMREERCWRHLLSRGAHLFVASPADFCTAGRADSNTNTMATTAALIACKPPSAHSEVTESFSFQFKSSPKPCEVLVSHNPPAHASRTYTPKTNTSPYHHLHHRPLRQF